MRISYFLRIWVVVFIPLLGFTPRLNACSDVFVWSGGEKVSSRNLDWGTQNAMLVTISPRGVSRKSVPLRSGDQPASWVSQYGTVVVRMYAFGAYMPIDGMNEHGLGGGLLMMLETEYPSSDSRPSISDVLWLFYFLDRAALSSASHSIARTAERN